MLWCRFRAPHATLRVAPYHPRNSDEITGGAGMSAGHAGYDMRGPGTEADAPVVLVEPG
jgi:hypothetical protein